MKRKNLLNENQVRKFMKLARIRGELTDTFVASKGLIREGKDEDAMRERGDEESMEERGGMMPPAKRDDEMREGDDEMREGDDEMREGDDMDEEEETALAPTDDAPEMDMDMDMGGEEISLSREEAVDLVDQIVNDLTVGLGMGDAEVTDDDMGDDMEMGDDDMDMEMGDDDVEIDDDVEMMDEEEIVNETLRRVAARLNGMNERQKIINEAYRRIAIRYGAKRGN